MNSYDEYELEIDDFGLAFMKAHAQFNVEIIKEVVTDQQKFYLVKVQELRNDGDHKLH